jgi:hypothetical protein
MPRLVKKAPSQGLQASEDATIASGGGLIAPAGAAGLGGSANDVTEEGQICITTV